MQGVDGHGGGFLYCGRELGLYAYEGIVFHVAGFVFGELAVRGGFEHVFDHGLIEILDRGFDHVADLLQGAGDLLVFGFGADVAVGLDDAPGDQAGQDGADKGG